MPPYAVPFYTGISAISPPSLQSDSKIISVVTDPGQNGRSFSTINLKQPATQFASALAHEIRNPLTNINLSVKVLESAIKDDDLKVYLDIIKRSSTRINNLLKEFLKYQADDEVISAKHSICHLLDEIIEMTEDRLMLKNITVRKKYMMEDYTLVLDRPKIKIALINIIVNAIDSMDHGKGELKLSTKSMNGKYIVQIEDNGCGISRKNLKKIFDPYFTNKTDGLGLGLATTYDILQANHAGLYVESDEGKGTRFTLSFEKDKTYKRFPHPTCKDVTPKFNS